MKIWGITDTGCVRRENQDSFAAFSTEHYTVGVVCDGMGGVGGGRIASAVAVDSFERTLRSTLRPDLSDQQLREAAGYCISAAHQAIRKRQKESRELENMGTTLVSAVVQPRMAVVSNVGDSRAYLISHKDGIRQISKDHSLVEDMVERGNLTADEARHHPHRNLITRALGVEETVEVDGFIVPWEAGDCLLLCSDGLVNTVTDQEILFEVMHSEGRDTCLSQMLEISRRRGAPDNVTAVLIENTERR